MGGPVYTAAVLRQPSAAPSSSWDSLGSRVMLKLLLLQCHEGDVSVGGGVNLQDQLPPGEPAGPFPCNPAKFSAGQLARGVKWTHSSP